MIHATNLMNQQQEQLAIRIAQVQDLEGKLAKEADARQAQSAQLTACATAATPAQVTAHHLSM